MEVLDYIRTSAVTVGTTAGRIVSGDRHLTFPLSTNGANCTIPLRINSSTESDAHFFQAQIGLSTDPSSEIGLLCTYASPTTERFVTIGTDRKIRVYDSAGVQVGHTSRNVISSSGMTHFAILYDYLLGLPQGSSGLANKAYICVWVNGQVEWDGLVVVASGTRLLPLVGTNLVWGEDLDAAVNRGAIMYMDDHDGDSMPNSVKDDRYAPHITARPIMQVVGAAGIPPTGNGSHTAWSNDFEAVDDCTEGGFTHDSDTSFCGDGTSAGIKETFTYSAANPTDSADTIHAVSMRCVKRNTGGAKNTPLALLRDASANEVAAAYDGTATSYQGEIALAMSRPGGGTWVYTDFDLTAGVSNLQFGMQAAAASAAGRVTSQPGPEIAKSEASMVFGRMWN